MKCKVMIARFPGNYHEDPDTVSWLFRTFREMLQDDRIEKVEMFVKSDTPITMVRNECVEYAKSLGIDYLLMIDNDMKPDFQRPGKPFKPFWKTAFDWIYRREAPSLICSPYVGPNPHNNVYIFHYSNFNNYEKYRFKLDQFTRFEAADRSGIEYVATIPTGLVLMDMRLFSRMKHPYFDYEWEGDGPTCPHCGVAKPGPRTRKSSTEDCYFGRNFNLAWRDTPGAGCYVLWDSWSQHIKRGYCDPPELPHANCLGVLFDDAIALGRTQLDTMQIVDTDMPVIQPASAEAGPIEWGIGTDGQPVPIIDIRDGQPFPMDIFRADPPPRVERKPIIGPDADGRQIIAHPEEYMRQLLELEGK